jgi:tRNA pseudouridine55 synthase
MLLLDKPAGITSNGALQQAKALLEVKKAGHTGSLDPIATGLLPLCFGEATKVSSFFLGADKRYWTRLKLGESTGTGDSEGRVVERRAVNVSEVVLDGVLEGFVGEFDQVPPMYSAVKKNGQPLYKLARQGIEIEREARRVRVYRLEKLALDGEFVDLDLTCSSGFYVRVLAQDIGDALGCGAHVVALRRLAVGDLEVGDAVTLDHIQALDSVAARRALLLPTDRGLAHLPAVELSVDAAFYLCRGQAVRAADVPSPGWVRLYSRDVGFLGLGTVLDDGRVAPKRLFTSGQPSRTRVVATRSGG